MSKKFTRAITHTLLVGLAVGGLITPSYGEAVEIYRTGWQPFEGSALNNCNGEWISTTGQYFSEMRFTEDGSGGLHIVVLDRLRIIGEGLATGSKYLSNEGATYTETDTTGGLVEYTVPIIGTLISLDQDVPDLHYSIRLHLTIDANGNLRSIIDDYEIFCR